MDEEAQAPSEEPSSETELGVIPPLTLADSAVLPALIAGSRRIRLQVLSVFAALGGPDRLLQWANKDDENLAKYYTQILPKVMPKEVEHTASGTLEDYLEQIDKAKADGTLIEGECERLT